MSAIKCTCGEWLIADQGDFVLCWFCRAEYKNSSSVKSFINYETQLARPVIKSLHEPKLIFQDRRNLRIGG